jgi:hypothetical protein
MAYIGNNPKWNTGTFTPQSADPSNPVEGMQFYSDGTSRSEGLWVYRDGAWAASTNALIDITVKTTTYTATTADETISADTSGGAWTLTLYTAVGNNGRTIEIKKTTSDTNILTIDANSTETIDGELTLKMGSQYDSVTLRSNGTNWLIINNNILVAASYTSNAGTSTVGSGTTTVLTYEDKELDTHNAYSSGVYTVPIKGLYSVNFGLEFQGSTFWDSGEEINAIIRVNSTEVRQRRDIFRATPAGSYKASASISTTMYLNQDDTVEFAASQTSGATLTLQGTTVLNFLDICKIK